MATREDKLSSKGLARILGRVVEVLAGSEHRVEITDKYGNKLVITAYTAPKVENNRIRIIEGDYVDIEISTQTAGKGRIVYRHPPTFKPNE